MPLHVAGPADRVEQLIALTKRLTALVLREAELYAQRRPLDAAAQREEAAALSALYRQETARIDKDRSLIAEAPVARRIVLRQLTDEFHEALQAHERVLAALAELTGGMVRAVAEHVAAERAKDVGYGPGAAAALARSGAAITVSTTA